MAKIYAQTEVTGSDIINSVKIFGEPLSLEELISKIISLVLYLVGALAFFYLIYAGILYITSANNPEQARKAQLALINVVIGVIIVALSYVILRTAGSIASFIVR